MNIVIPGWTVSVTGWNETNGGWWRGYVLKREFEQYFGRYSGIRDDATFESAVRTKVAALS